MVITFLGIYFLNERNTARAEERMGATSVLMPVQGGTGTSTIPTYGQILVGQSNGKYIPTSTITATTSFTNKVGIGTTNPAYALDVKDGDIAIFDTQNSVKGLRLFRNSVQLGGMNTNNSVTTFYGAPTYGLQFTVSSSVNAMTILPSGNVGIKTTNPTYQFEAGFGSTNTVGDFALDGTNKIIYLGRQSPTSGDNSIVKFRDRLGGVKFRLNAGASESTYFGNFGVNYGVKIWNATADLSGTTSARLEVDSGNSTFPSAVFLTGNVGIGTTTPTNLLSIEKNSANGEFIGSEVFERGKGVGIKTGVWKQGAGAYDLAGLWASPSTPSNLNYIFGTTGATSDTYFNAPSGKGMYFQNSGTSLMTILSTGNVGIGTTTPKSKLQVTGTGTTTMWIGSFGQVGQFCLGTPSTTASVCCKANDTIDGLTCFTTSTY